MIKRGVLMDIMNLTEIMDKSVEIVRKHVKTIVLYNIGIGIVEFLIAVILTILSAIIFVVSNIAASNYVATGVLIFMIATVALGLYFCINVGIIKITGQEYL